MLALQIVGIPILVGLCFVGLVNVLQARAPKYLPRVLQDWQFLPPYMRSLEPYDDLIRKVSCGKLSRENQVNAGLENPTYVEEIS